MTLILIRREEIDTYGRRHVGDTGWSDTTTSQGIQKPSEARRS
jgi:hypothetical protein